MRAMSAALAGYLGGRFFMRSFTRERPMNWTAAGAGPLAAYVRRLLVGKFSVAFMIAHRFIAFCRSGSETTAPSSRETAGGASPSAAARARLSAGAPASGGPRDTVALMAWAVSYTIVGVSCGAAGAMALYLTTEETTLALVGWGAAAALGPFVVEPVWVMLVVLVGSLAACMRRCWCWREERGDWAEEEG